MLLTDKRTNTQTNAGKNITSLAEVTKLKQKFVSFQPTTDEIVFVQFCFSFISAVRTARRNRCSIAGNRLQLLSYHEFSQSICLLSSFDMRRLAERHFQTQSVQSFNGLLTHH